MMKSKDNIYSETLSKIVDFKFDDNVANVFPDMLNRSIPGYGTIISIIGMLSAEYAKPNTICYDLGSSLGAASLSMRKSISDKNVKIIGFDNSEAMISKCNKLVTEQNYQNIEFQLEDVNNVEIKNASVIVLNFTLQFIEKSKRDTLIQKIYNGLCDGGLLIISEKIKVHLKSIQERQTDWYHNFKKLNGYSDLEISQKRTALENILIPESEEAHKERIFEAGFSTCDTWFRCFNFISMAAIK